MWHIFVHNTYFRDKPPLGLVIVSISKTLYAHRTLLLPSIAANPIQLVLTDSIRSLNDVLQKRILWHHQATATRHSDNLLRPLNSGIRRFTQMRFRPSEMLSQISSSLESADWYFSVHDNQVEGITHARSPQYLQNETAV